MKSFNTDKNIEKTDDKNEPAAGAARQNRQERREEVYKSNKKKGDLTRKSTHKMRSHTGQRDYVDKVVDGFNRIQAIGGKSKEKEKELR
ncbi:hypothetical protein DA01_03605 [Dehalococcoides mccartyi]|uniref:Uncharacterized protein n=1 Tax=Dehalococcoides mccartyi TaxID=61435 RepID=A0A0V8LY50_9CHLR|nr:hypothetical protein [Dehalococcoides mccartyi]KSV16463.1 hypothetical protein DA01_03605 [Dehalococcoides mccartyi]